MASIKNTFSANGNADTTKLWSGGSGSMMATGDFGGGTLKLQWSIDNGTTWVDFTSGSLTANGLFNFTVGPCLLRANLAGSTNPNLLVVVAGGPYGRS